MRTFSEGRSFNTVPMPVRTAELAARSRCTSARAASPVIHWLSPEAMAVRPSRLMASFTRTQGRPRVMRLTKPGLSASASASSTPAAASMPAACRRASPWPATCGFGSVIAATTRATPASTSASAQGGVRPK